MLTCYSQVHSKIDFAWTFQFFSPSSAWKMTLRDWCIIFQLLGDCCSTFLAVWTGYHVTKLPGQLYCPGFTSRKSFFNSSSISCCMGQFFRDKPSENVPSLFSTTPPFFSLLASCCCRRCTPWNASFPPRGLSARNGPCKNHSSWYRVILLLCTQRTVKKLFEYWKD